MAFPKIIELGVLGVCDIFLIVKGVNALNNLTTVVEKLVTKVEAVDKKFESLERFFRDTEKVLERIERKLEYDGASQNNRKNF